MCWIRLLQHYRLPAVLVLVYGAITLLEAESSHREKLCSFTPMMLMYMQLCKACFYEVFEDEVHQTIVTNKLFKSGEKVAIGASGNSQVTPPNSAPCLCGWR